jgi:hypothetical protein
MRRLSPTRIQSVTSSAEEQISSSLFAILFATVQVFLLYASESCDGFMNQDASIWAVGVKNFSRTTVQLPYHTKDGN